MLHQLADVNRFKKRERTQNWAYEEKRYLLDLCKKDMSIIENKRLDADLTALKNRAWEIIHQEFTKSFGTERNCNRLKEQWRRMKACTRAEIVDYHHRITRYGQEIANQKVPSPFTFEIWDFMQEAKKACRSEAMEGVDYSKFQLALEDGAPDGISFEFDDDNNDWPKVSQNMCEVEIKYETSDSDDEPSNSKRPCSTNSANLNSSAVLNDETTPTLSINNVGATLNTLKLLKIPQFANAQQTVNGDEHSCNNGCTKLLEMQSREHAVRMEILQLKLQTAKFNRDVAELNKMIALKSANGLNGTTNGQI